MTVLDVSAAALDRAKARLGESEGRVTWIETDVTDAPPLCCADLWHDRAVFHFLTDPEDRRLYVAQIHRTVKAGGAVIIATFAPDGPERCSGLPVVRYSPETLNEALGPRFVLREAV